MKENCRIAWNSFIYISHFEMMILTSPLCRLILPFDAPCIYRAYVYHARDSIIHIRGGGRKKDQHAHTHVYMCGRAFMPTPDVHLHRNHCHKSTLRYQTRRNPLENRRRSMKMWLRERERERERRGLHMFR